MKQPLFKMAVPILALPRAAKRFVALSVDLGRAHFCGAGGQALRRA